MSYQGSMADYEKNVKAKDQFGFEPYQIQSRYKDENVVDYMARGGVVHFKAVNVTNTLCGGIIGVTSRHRHMVTCLQCRAGMKRRQ